jgi:hypothetical protein
VRISGFPAVRPNGKGVTYCSDSDVCKSCIVAAEGGAPEGRRAKAVQATHSGQLVTDPSGRNQSRKGTVSAAPRQFLSWLWEPTPAGLS